MRVTVDVLQSDIDEGLRCDGHNCMLALALNRMTNCHTIANVGAMSVLFTKLRASYEMSARIPLPDDAYHMRYLFDSIEPHERIALKPFSFQMEIPLVFLKETIVGFHALLNDLQRATLEVDLPDVLTTQDLPNAPKPETELVPA